MVPPWTFIHTQSPLASDLMEEKFWNVVREACTNSLHFCTNSTLLLLNSGIWDLLEDGTYSNVKHSGGQNIHLGACCDYDADFRDHIESLRSLLSRIQSEFPHVTIGWKSMTAAHVHRVTCGNEDKKCQLRIKYMSYSQSDFLHQKQLKLLQLDFPNVLLINLYNLTYNRAHYSKPSDGSEPRVCHEMWNQAFGVHQNQ